MRPYEHKPDCGKKSAFVLIWPRFTFCDYHDLRTNIIPFPNLLYTLKQGLRIEIYHGKV